MAIGRWLDGKAHRSMVDPAAGGGGGIRLGNREAELPVDHFIEWLAEWGREVRRRQTGLMLLTAHRAKGLEFDHVAVLDGGWDRVGQNEDADAAPALLRGHDPCQKDADAGPI